MTGTAGFSLPASRASARAGRRGSTSMKTLAAVVLAIGAILTGAFASDLRPIVNPAVESGTLEVGEKAAGASLLGQFRTSAAASLFARADVYLHGGVELRPMTKAEQHAGKQGSDVHEDEEEVLGDESHLVTTIPSPKEDYRGLLGDLERETTAYKDMHNHKHNDPETTFPLFRLMTWVDPQFIDGWTIGSMLLANNYTDEQIKRALDYLGEGLRANPDSIEILTQIGVIHASRKRDLNTALEYFERAHRVIQSGRYGATQAEAVALTYRWLLITYDQQGNRAKQLEIIREALPKFPEDQVLLRYALKLGLEPAIPKSP
jgi:tetratricopeptide (TPR) repeat protein